MPLLSTLGTFSTNNPGYAPTYEITPTATTIEEGDSVTFTINTTKILSGTVLFYSIETVSGTINNSTFLDNTLTGSFIITNNTGSFSKTTNTDSNSTPDSFKVSVRRDSIVGEIVAESPAITITDIADNHLIIAYDSNDTFIPGDTAVDASTGSHYAAITVYLGGSTTNRAMRLLKFTNQGSLDWARQISFNLSGGTNSCIIGGVRVDSNGDIIILARVAGVTNERSSRLFFLVKYSSLGTLLWQRQIGPSSDTNYNLNGTNSISLDGSNNIYVSGSVTTNDAQGSTTQKYHALVAKYNSSGSLQWHRYVTRNGTAGWDILSSEGCFADSAGNVYMAVDGSVNRSDPEIGVVKYNTSGTIQWQKAYVSTTSRSLSGITGNDEYVYVSGLVSISSTNRPTVIRLTSAGATSFVRYISTQTQPFRELSIDDSGNYYGSVAARIYKFPPSGALTWARTYGSQYGVLAQRGSKYYMSGTASSGTRTFIVKAPNDGSLTGSYTVSGVTVNYTTVSDSSTTTSLTQTNGTYTNNTTTLVTSSTATYTNSDVTSQIINDKVGF